MALKNIGLKTSSLSDAELIEKMPSLLPGEVILQTRVGSDGAVWWKDAQGRIRVVGKSSDSVSGVESVNGMQGVVVLGLNDLVDCDTSEKEDDAFLKYVDSTGNFEASTEMDGGFF